MIDERVEAVRKLRQEADNLRLACIAATGGAAMLHIAYNQNLAPLPTLDEAILLGRLGGLQL